jgi:hypothetical protein
MVMMWRVAVWFSHSNPAAMVVDFPEPVDPVTKMRPEERESHFWKTATGRPNSSMEGI